MNVVGSKCLRYASEGLSHQGNHEQKGSGWPAQCAEADSGGKYHPLRADPYTMSKSNCQKYINEYFFPAGRKLIRWLFSS